jgi:hypothetical protein
VSALAARLAALEARQYDDRFTFITTAGRTVHVPVDEVLGIFLGDPLPASLVDVAGTPEAADLAHAAVRAAIAARMKGRPDAGC